MSVFGMALQLTIKTQLWQMTMMQRIDRHRVALRALEARSAIDASTRINRGGEGASGNALDSSNGTGEDDKSLARLTSWLPSPEWRQTRDVTGGGSLTLCWHEAISNGEGHLNDKGYEVNSLSDHSHEESIDAIHCQSLAVS